WLYSTKGLLMVSSARVVLLCLALASPLCPLASGATPCDPQQSDARQEKTPPQANPPAVTPPPTIRIPRVSRPPKLEDFLKNTPREAEARVSGFRQREPHDGEPSTHPTTGYLSYDDKNVYVVLDCKDEPGQVRAHMSKREDIFNDDVVGVMLDTFHDRRRAYEFFVNPLGIQLDGTTVEGQNDDFSFDTLWHSEGKLTADGFIVFLAIPFKSLRFSGADVQSWGIALFRSVARSNEQSFWPYITRRVQGFCQQMATAEGFERLS